jgi:hypothetical protein
VHDARQLAWRRGRSDDKRRGVRVCGRKIEDLLDDNLRLVNVLGPLVIICGR